MIVASEIGTIVMIEVMRSETSVSLNIENTVLFQWIGRPIHAASFTEVKSTLPVTAATMYEPSTPRIIGMIFIMPLPQMFAATTITIATRAIHQCVAQLLMADDDRLRPIAMMIGPVTIGGKNLITRLIPNALKSPAIMK